ncbi:MAG: pilus assembly protein [Gammaproteobacteria bacterium]|nr:pilus assembly protein [Gammaproteobacteria bacterium]
MIRLRQHAQQGAALVVSLVILVIVTMLGLTTLNTSVMEERMAGNTRSREIAFEAAEAAVREAEDTIQEGNFYATDPKDGTTNSLHIPQDDANPVPGNNDSELWYQGTWRTPGAGGSNGIAQGWTDREADTGEGELGQTADTPQFVVEYLTFFTRDLNCGADIQAAQTTDCYRYAYRVTGRGWGTNTATIALVQSMFADRK